MSARIRTITAALLAVLGSALPVLAGEGTPAVIVHANGACTSCEVVPTATTHMKLSGQHPIRKHIKPLPTMNVTLCPGACFGYFPTQWRSWDEACGIVPPVPHAGPDFTPMIPPSSDMLPGKNGRAPDPRSVDPMNPMKMKSGIAPLNVRISRIN